MKSLLLPLVLSATCISATLQWQNLHPSFVSQRHASPQGAGDHVGRRQSENATATNTTKFLNDRTRKFAVDGANLPNVGFDVGESYSGLLPIGEDDDPNQLFYWFFPSESELAEKEILLWVTGGPGCSSVGELLQENGPLLWQPGTFAPVRNPWSWNRLTNVVWVDQPVGAGFSVGNVTARNEQDVADQFLGFWKKFVDTFSLQGYKVYVTGSSYSGMYCPYIAGAMLDAQDPTYFDVNGMMIFDGLYSNSILEQDLVAASFHDRWENVLAFNDTFKTELRSAAQKCGYADYVSKYLVYPAAGVQPSILPGSTPDGSAPIPGCDHLFSVFSAATETNPCFSVYDVLTTCPRRFDPLGFADGVSFVANGSTVYFDRADVKAAIHAPDKPWFFCQSGNAGGVSVFANGTDDSLLSGPGSQPVLPGVIDRTENVIIAHGARDFVLVAEGALLTFQNITWGGMLGFQSDPRAGDRLVMPPLSDAYASALQSQGSVVGLTAGGGQGVVGTVHTERGFTFLGIDTSGHFLSMVAPEVSFRALEVLLGRVDGFDGAKPYTVDIGVAEAAISTGAGGNSSSSSAGGVYGSAGNAMQAGQGSGAAEPVKKTSSAAGSLDVRDTGLLTGLLAFGFALRAM